MGIRIIQGLLVTAALVAATDAAAQGASSSGGQTTIHLAPGLFSGSYEQASQNSSLATSDTSPQVKVQGTAVDAGVVIAGVDVDLSYKSLSAKSNDWYKARTDMDFALGPRFDAVSWLIPSLGVYQLTQSSDRSVEDAPIAFIDKTTTLSLGLRAEGAPVALGDLGIIMHGKAYYLTSGEARANFGTLTEAGIGYGVKSGTFAAGFTIGASRTFLDAATTKDGTTRSVHSVLQGNVLSFFLQY